MYIHHIRLLLLLVLIIAQHTGYTQTITRDCRIYRDKPPRHRITFKEWTQISYQRLEFAADAGVGFIINQEHIDSGRIDPKKTKGRPVPYGSMRVFHNTGVLQIGVGWETGSLSIETLLPITNAQTGVTRQRKGKVYLASPFHTISGYINAREEVKNGYWYGGISGGYIFGKTRSNVANDYQPTGQTVTGGIFGIVTGYAFFTQHLGINIELGLHATDFNNGRQAAFVPLSIGIRYRNHPGFHTGYLRNKYRKPAEPAEQSIII